MQVTKAMELKVGVIVGLGLILFVISVLLLGENKSVFSSTIEFNLKLKQVQGLANGSVVQVLGIPVGNVKVISVENIENVNYVVVKMSVNKEHGIKLTQGTQAGLRTQGALGDKYIFITPGPLDNQKLKEGDFLDPETSGDFFEKLSSSTEKFEKIFDVINEAHKLLTDINENRKSARLLENLTSASKEFKDFSIMAKELLRDIKGQNKNEGLQSSVFHLANILEKIDKGQGTLGGLVNDPSVYEGLKNIVGNNPRKKYLKNIIHSTIDKSAEKNDND